MSEKTRADIALVLQHLCESRERAQKAIMEGRVFIGEKRIKKPSDVIHEHDILILKENEHEYVSRGALKLEKAIRVFRADLNGKTVMDIGSSTGGFTDICLRNGANHVYSIDVGYGQLDWKLRNDPRVTVMERTNARYLKPEMFDTHPDITVMDVSFISIKMILPVAAGIMGNEGIFYTLIKPQFEAGREKVGKNGVIRDPSVHRDVLNDILIFTEDMGWRITAMDYSPITGPKGNIEFLAEIQEGNRVCKVISDQQINDLVATAHNRLNRS